MKGRLRGRLSLMKAQLEKERLELEKQKEEEACRRKEKTGVPHYVLVDVPSQASLP